jgi:lipopolysaccharide export system protein LptA
VPFLIERIRTTILIAGLLLIAALGVFLTVGHWRSPFNRRDLPKKLGIDIQQVANGFTHAEFHAGHALFKITASKVEQLKDSRYRLHAVQIEMYRPNEPGADRIEGSEFEYDQQAGIAKAAGPVEITLDRPSRVQSASGTQAHENGKSTASAPQDGQPDLRQIHVKTIGLTFDQKSGVASSANHVEFDLPQASGSAMSASYDSQHGELVLTGSVELNAQRGSDTVRINAQRADFARDSYLCMLASATAKYRHGDARAQQAKISFRDDGSAEELDATNGLELTTASGGRVAAPTGSLRFNASNQPVSGHLDGGVVLDSHQDDRSLQGKAPSAVLEFAPAGLLHRVHLERGVDFTSNSQTAKGGIPTQSRRAWTSPVADLDFRDAGDGRVEIASVHGTGGVTVTSESRRGNAAPAHARMTSDEMIGTFGPDSTLSAMTGSGHAVLDQTTESGARQTTSGDRVEAHFSAGPPSNRSASTKSASGPALQIDKATVLGNVVLTQQAASSPGEPATIPLRATAQRADYDGTGELHLSGSPHVENGEIALDADKVDVARVSGDAFAHGSVKASWFGNQASGLGGQGPAHVVASEAQLHQANGQATFRGNARLWQQADSVSAPVILLDRTRQTLTAQTTNPSDPVKVVLVGAGSLEQKEPGKRGSPSVVRVRGGDLKYSEAERKAVMRGGALGGVVAETADETTRSNEVDLILLPAGNHAGNDGGSAQVDRLTARGNVSIESQGRRGTGEKLDYSSERAEYVLTGTAANPPRMTDPARGTVTGESLIFNSRDDSVNVEGGQRATTTETTAPKQP